MHRDGAPLLFKYLNGSTKCTDVSPQRSRISYLESGARHSNGFTIVYTVHSAIDRCGCHKYFESLERQPLIEGGEYTLFSNTVIYEWCWTKRGGRAMKRHHKEPPKKWAWWVLLSQLRAPTGVSRTILVQVVSFMLAKIRFVHQSGVFSIWGASSWGVSSFIYLWDRYSGVGEEEIASV